MDMAESVAPRSDQMNADDLIVGPMTVTIADVTPGTSEQPVNVHTVEMPGRPYKPSKSMRRVLIAAWDRDSSAYIGQRMTLYRNEKIRFGRDEVGGIEISHMTGLDADLKVSLTATRGKKRLHTVKPLAAPAPYKPSRDFITEVQAAESTDAKRAVWSDAVADGADEAYLNEIKRAGS